VCLLDRIALVILKCMKRPAAGGVGRSPDAVQPGAGRPDVGGGRAEDWSGGGGADAHPHAAVAGAADRCGAPAQAPGTCDAVGGALRVVLPDGPPVLTRAAARALLRILLAAQDSARSGEGPDAEGLQARADAR
jgi:hypothetical protein